MRRVRERLRWLGRDPDVAIAHPFRQPPYGGSNQFLLALRRELESRGLGVSEHLVRPGTRACVLNAYLVDRRALRRQLHDGCRVVHRVDGPLAAYRGFDDGTDELIAAINDEFAATTVFQSRYSLQAHLDRGLELRSPVVVHNAVDRSIFHPGPTEPRAGRRIRLISTSWSDNANKGAPTLRAIERELDWSRFEWTFVGRTPVEFERIRTLGPVGSERLAELLRGHDAYVIASRNEPCSNALLEALSCGLPAVYRDSGANAELVGAGGVGFREDDELPERIEELVERYDDLRRAIDVPTIERVTDAYLEAMGIAR